MLERSLRQRFLTLYWPYFPAGAVRARFSSPRLSISRISFYEIVTAYRALWERLFFLKIEYFYRSLLPFSHVLFSIKEKLDRFFFVLFVLLLAKLQNKKDIDFFLDKFIPENDK